MSFPFIIQPSFLKCNICWTYKMHTSLYVNRIFPLVILNGDTVSVKDSEFSIVIETATHTETDCSYDSFVSAYIISFN